MADEDEILRGVYTECNECAQDDKKGQHHCHAERSEASPRHSTEMLRCAQHDRVALSMTVLVEQGCTLLCHRIAL